MKSINQLVTEEKKKQAEKQKQYTDFWSDRKIVLFLNDDSNMFSYFVV